MFVKIAGERFNVLLREGFGAWVISYDEFQMPVYVDGDAFSGAERIPAPDEYIFNAQRERTKAMRDRLAMIQPLLEDTACITDPAHRRQRFREVAAAHQTTEKRIRRLYHGFLARGCLIQSKPRAPKKRRDYDEAIRKYYFSAKRNSLRGAYELFILENYTNGGAGLEQEIPTWDSFRHYYYRNYGGDKQKDIAREGLTSYQRNKRPLYGSAMQYRENIGCYQVDETQGDIYLVSKWDRSKVVGRPIVYLAIDTATGLIAGVHVGLEAGENAMMACIANAAMDKREYCAAYGIDLDPKDWPSRGLPSEIISDRGGEFVGSRIDELCICYGIDLQAVPPFRAEEKPLVERAMELIQESYKSMLRGKGVIGDDVNERWAKDYRKQAVLTLEEYTAILIHCIISLNKGRVLTEIGHLPVEAPNTPASLWAWLMEQGQSSLLDIDAGEVYRRSLPRTKGQVTRKGILYNGMRYLPVPGTELPAGTRVEFAYDTQNTEAIFVLDEGMNMIPCLLAPSSARFSGYTMEDAAYIRAAENEKIRSARRNELAARVEMRSEIQKIIRSAEAQSIGDADISDIQGCRSQERRKLS